MKFYNLEFGPYGSESVIGTISEPQYNYWSKNEDRLSESLNVFDNDNEGIPTNAQIHQDWFEIDDIAHANGPILNDDNNLNFAIIETDLNGVEISRQEHLFNIKNLVKMKVDCTRKSFNDDAELNDKFFFIGLKADRELMLEAVRIDGSLLEYADETLKKDKEIVLAAVKLNQTQIDQMAFMGANSFDGVFLEHADDSLKADREVVLEAVRNNGFSIEHADDSLKTDREIILETVRSAGDMLKLADDSLKSDREIVFEAVKNRQASFRYASEELQNDPELKKIAKNYIESPAYEEYLKQKD